MIFPVVMYRCESWSIKKGERWRIDGFELLREDSQESLGLQGDQTSQSWKKLVLNIHWKGWKLKLQYFDHLMKSRLTGKDPDAGKDWRQKKGTSEDEMVRLNGHEFEQFQEIVKLRGAWHAAIHGVAKSQTRLSTEQL